LSHNKLVGSLPEVFDSLPQLQMVNFEWNRLSGSIPNTLASCPLQTLYVPCAA
jgi:hypothetical protein